jgi:hypothetical protein
MRSFHLIGYSGAGLGFFHMRNTYLNLNFNAPPVLGRGIAYDLI